MRRWRDLDGGPAGPDTGDRLEGGGEDRGLDPVEGARDGDCAERLPVLGVDLDVDASDLRRLLEVAEIQVVAEEAFGLAEDGPDDVGAFHDAVSRDCRVNEVFFGVFHW